ncbi:MAG: iron chaperone [Culicoidibacterales bacterium]
MSIDEYIANQPEAVRPKLQQLAALIRELAPTARETFSYQMPTFYLNGNLVHFAAFRQHIGFYPGPSGVAYVQAELEQAGLKWAKGSIQFRLDQPLPEALIRKIVIFRVNENEQAVK